MRYLVCFLMILFPISSFALDVAEIQFVKGSVRHIYRIKFIKEKSFLSFKESQQQLKIKRIGDEVAKDLIAEANRIVWKSAYKKPKLQKMCSQYATISINDGKSEIICSENRLAMSHAYGFLNKLNDLK